MIFSRILLPLMCVVALTNGCIFDSDNNKSDSAKKGSVSGTVKLTVTGDPVVGMKVYLIKTHTTVDSTDADAILSRSAFVDSAVTDANGKYSITNVAPGNYGVAPVSEDTTAVYTFTQAAGSDSCAFSMNGNSLSVNFIAEKADYPGVIYEDSDYIIDHVSLTNSGKPFENTVTYVAYKRHWVVFVPFLSEECRVTVKVGGFITKYLPGYTGVLYTDDNCFFYEITIPNSTKVHKFSIYHPLSTPAGSKFEYTFDFATDTLTQTK
jgi:hypothetical protein